MGTIRSSLPAIAPLTQALLVGIVAVAFTTEAAIGFGATLISVALGSLLIPIDELLYSFVPVNITLSAAILVRAYRHLDGRTLGARILPAMLLGLPIGMFAFEKLPKARLQMAFGVFIVALGTIELVQQARATSKRRADQGATAMLRPLPKVIAWGLLFLGGVVHGAFATGGPPVVYVCGRTIADKSVFRSTLAGVWLLLNLLLLVGYVHNGHIDGASITRSLLFVPALIVGLFLGEIAHGRVPERAFRRAVFAMLVVVGIVLALRA